MKFGILTFPGVHGDRELKYILEEIFHISVEFIWYKDKGPFRVAAVLVPAGFPCSPQQNAFDCHAAIPAMEALHTFAEQGKYVLGLGNGFQALCQSGLLPGMLRTNDSDRFLCRYVYIKPDNDYIALTHDLNSEHAYRIPLATYIGQYSATEEELRKMRLENQIVFRFCDPYGRITESVNYTGSVDNIAAVCNQRKNVLGMIPLPERAVIYNEGFGDGKEILESFISFL